MQNNWNWRRRLWQKYFQQRGFTKQRNTINNIWRRVEVKATNNPQKKAALIPSGAMADEWWSLSCCTLHHVWLLSAICCVLQYNNIIKNKISHGVSSECSYCNLDFSWSICYLYKCFKVKVIILHEILGHRKEITWEIAITQTNLKYLFLCDVISINMLMDTLA